MIAEDTCLTNLWYVAGLSASLGPGKMRREMMLGEPVLLGRLRDGEAFALRDICPHRGVPLSAGRIEADATVECPYHGWRFTKAGQCSHIPSLVGGEPVDPAKISVRRYHLREQDGLVWIHMPADPRAAPADVPPRIPIRAGDGTATPRFVEAQDFPCSIDHAAVGLMDPAHGPFVHKSWWWRSRKSIHAKTKKYAPAPRGFTMVAHRPSSNSFAYRILGGEVTTEIRFELPGLRFEHIRAGKHEILGFTACTPREAGRTEVTQVFYWTMGWANLIRPLFRPFARAFLSQDRAMVELQQEGLKFSPRLMLIQDADVPAMWYHRLKKAWAESVATGAPFVNPVPETTLRWRS